MKKSIYFLAFISILFSCNSEDYDDVIHYEDVNQFVWKGLNQYYYWQGDEPNLADNAFATTAELNTFLDGFASPEELFEELLVPRTTDRFSVIFSNYTVLEGILQGNTQNNGMDYELRSKSASSEELFGWVRYVLPNSDAAAKNIQRGTIFYAINGVPLTKTNYRNLLANTTYTLNFADYDNGNITPNGNSISLTKTSYQENPVYYKNVYTLGAKKVGYLMYNGFYTDFESQLNDAFTYFKNENITHFILDLRYNSGGSVATATRLASMITGQFTNQIFAKQQWNSKLMAYFSANNPEQLNNRFTTTIGNGTSISSLQLDKVYVLTSKASASASELVINGLASHINVVQIGDTTTGKNVGSVTLYDSPSFTKSNVNPMHKYAMQPIVLKIVNSNNFGDYTNGLAPTVPFIENIGNLGEIGETSDLLLNTALNYIEVNGRMTMPSPSKEFEFFKDSKTNFSENIGMVVEIKK